MRVLVMRHGAAFADSPTGRDCDRSLTPAGQERTRAVARELARRGERPRILSSPLARARQTAALVAEILGVDPPEIEPDLAPGEDAEPRLRALARDGAGSTLVVSHMPDVAHLAGRLLGSFVSGFDTSRVVAIDLGAGTSTRAYAIDPDALG